MNIIRKIYKIEKEHKIQVALGTTGKFQVWVASEGAKRKLVFKQLTDAYDHSDALWQALKSINKNP